MSSSDDGAGMSMHGGLEIKQERMETSPESLGHHLHGSGNVDNGDGQCIKLEPSDMKPPPEKKMKM